MDDGDHSTSSDEEHNTTCASPDVNRKPKLKNKTISTSSSTSLKKSGRGGGRRLMQKRVVSVPIADIERSRPKGSGEGAPPPDSWTWRKYGQKPIKGSPYPRGYYRCSSSKGCPARKQVERSRLDPTTLLVTYTSDHNHPSPSTHHHHHQPPPPPPPPSTTPTDNKLLSNEYCTTTTFSPDLDEDSPLVVMAPAGLCWHPFMADTSLSSDSISTAPFSYDDDDIPTRGEEDSLFEGLGELPECAMIFRRPQNNRRCSFPAASL